jgi:2-polyprenyl-6-methoxyphenol hydroxylase-like FAD-dependent oxidoreductase
VHIPYDAQALAWGVSRGKLTAVLQRRLRELDGNLELGTHVTGIVDIRTEPSVMLETRMKDGTPRNWMFDAVVLACGSNSSLAERNGFGKPPAPYDWGSLNGLIRVDAWRYERELRQRVCGAKRMMGLLPSGRDDGKLLLSFYWSLPAEQYKAWVDRDWADFLTEVTRFWPESSPVLADLTRENLSFARYRHSTPTTYARGRVALVGDAAHAMSPQLGLGSTLALEDALELAESLVLTRDVTAAFADYSRARLPAARGKQRLSRALTPLFQSRLPAWVRDPLFLLGQHIPGIPGFMQASLGL